MKRSIDEEYPIYFYDYDNNLFELHTETLKKDWNHIGSVINSRLKYRIFRKKLNKIKYESKTLIAEYRYLSKCENSRFFETAYRLKEL
ncbi:hypothetical protein [Clostridium beijerinckii]|uniref:hypothetical protein n=1 Tax=Clostridium beijerinckii TaxID=1520 RepID=UPI00047AD50A|nr:hypothetical protein [Clostridium beijerinckii]